jgi:CspA family cold shock protein
MATAASAVRPNKHREFGKVYIKIAVISFVLALPIFALSSIVEFGVKPSELADFSFWLRHPLGILGYSVITTLVLFLFQALSGQGQSAKEQKEEGNVKWFSSSKGYGFITRKQGEDVFVHYRSIVGKGHRSLYEGQVVSFSVSEGEKGLQADDVVVVSDVKKRNRHSR